MGRQFKTMEIAGKTFKLYKPLVSSIPYLIGVNVADRIGDTSTIVIAHPQSMHTMAVYKSKIIAIEGLEKILFELVYSVIPNATICVIRNSTGLRLLDNIMRSSNTAKHRLYYENDGNIKRYGVDGNKAHAVVDLNAIVSAPNVHIDDIPAIVAATYVYNMNKRQAIKEVETAKDIRKSEDMQIDITLSKSMKEKLDEMAKCESVTVEMLVNQILAMEIGRFNK